MSKVVYNPDRSTFVVKVAAVPPRDGRRPGWELEPQSETTVPDLVAEQAEVKYGLWGVRILRKGQEADDRAAADRAHRDGTQRWARTVLRNHRKEHEVEFENGLPVEDTDDVKEAKRILGG